jgi:hypothetical protein
MRRRTFLGALGLSALAGCSSDGDDGSGGATGTPVRTTGTTSTSGGPAEFEFVGVQAPDAIPLNQPSIFAIGVRNVGGTAGTFVSDLRTRRDGGEWETAGEVSMELAPGELGEWQSPSIFPRYLSTVDYRLVAFDETWSIEFVPAERDFGIGYSAPSGLIVNVLGGTFESAYPTDGGNETETTQTEPADGGKWVVMEVDVRNGREEPRQAPDPSTFGFEVDGESREPNQSISPDPYRGGELDAKTVERGEFVYPVPADARADDLTMWWADTLPDGDVRVVWTR